MKTHRYEQGQVLVLIILSIVGLMGFAALAVDGGQVYAERRHSQAAADAAALAAASKFQDHGSPDDIRAAGLALASQNGYIHGDKDGTTKVEVYNPPTSGPYSEVSDRNKYFQVIITSKVKPIFAQFVFSGDQYITTEAVVRAENVSQLSSGNAIFALNNLPSSQPGIGFKGNVGVHVDGGNIFSNSDAAKDGAAGVVEATGGGKTYTHEGFELKGADCGPGKTVNPCPVTGVDTQTVPDAIEPYCPPSTATNPTTITGINYYVWPTSGSVPEVLQPGIHCFYDGITLHGGDSLKGDGVLLVFKKGGLTVTGNPKMELTRPDDLFDSRTDQQYGGMLIFVSKTNVNSSGEGPTITMGGTADSRINGTVYAPRSTCDLGGTSQGNAFHTALICNNFSFHGTQDVWITYKAEENYQFPASLSVNQ